jgi:hypothetical protein
MGTGAFGGPPVYKGIKEGSAADPMSVLQDQVAIHGSKLNMGDLRPDRIHYVEKQLVDKNLDAEDVRIAVGILDGMKLALESKREEASDTDKDFWDEQVDDVSQMRISVSELMYKTDEKLKGSNIESVGSVVRTALGPIDRISTGSRVAEAMKTYGKTGTEIAREEVDRLARAIDIYAPLEIPIDATEYLRKRLEGINLARASAHKEPFVGRTE